MSTLADLRARLTAPVSHDDCLDTVALTPYALEGLDASDLAFNRALEVHVPLGTLPREDGAGRRVLLLTDEAGDLELEVQLAIPRAGWSLPAAPHAYVALFEAALERTHPTDAVALHSTVYVGEVILCYTLRRPAGPLAPAYAIAEASLAAAEREALALARTPEGRTLVAEHQTNGKRPIPADRYLALAPEALASNACDFAELLAPRPDLLIGKYSHGVAVATLTRVGADTYAVGVWSLLAGDRCATRDPIPADHVGRWLLEIGAPADAFAWQRS